MAITASYSIRKMRGYSKSVPEETRGAGPGLEVLLTDAGLPLPSHVVSFEQPWTWNAETGLEGPLSTLTRNHGSWGLIPAALRNWGR